MRNAFVYLGDLSKGDIADLTRVLSRRPDYGIARPSTRWLSRQQSKIESLPKSLLRTTNLLHRLTISVATRIERIDEKENGQKILPPSAILCRAHQPLNPYLIRDVLLHLAAECSGDYTNALRAWPGKSPAVAAFLTRIDSINAYWMSKEAFQATFGAAPHDERFVRILSNCEACILAALGANGQTLSDLYAWLKVRKEANRRYNEDAKKRNSRRRKHSPRLYRLVEAWISHMKPADAEVVYRGADALLPELQNSWPTLEKARHELRKDAQRANVHREIYLDKDGSSAEVHHRTRDGLPMPMVNPQASALQRDMADLHKGLDVKSVYRADSVLEEGELFTEEMIHEYRELCRDLPRIHANRRAELQARRPGAPEPPRYSTGARSDEPPRESFIRQFEREVPLASPADCEAYFDDTYGHEYDEHDPEAEARSVAAVREWYSKMAMSQTRTDLNDMGSNSIHPAFHNRQVTDAVRGGYVAPSAVPEPLRLKKDIYVPASADWSQRSHGEVPATSTGFGDCETRTEWTDATVYTTGSVSNATDVDLGNAPPLPQIASQYSQSQHQQRDYSSRGSPSTDNHSMKEMPAPSLSHSSRSSPSQVAPSFGAAPPPRPQTRQNRRKYLFHDNDSDVASRLTDTNRNYLRTHRGLRVVHPEENPFVRSDSVRSQRSRGETVRSSPVGSLFGMPQQNPPASSSGGDRRPHFEESAALNAEAEEPVHGRRQEQQRRRQYQAYTESESPDAGEPARAQPTHGNCHGYDASPKKRESSRPANPGAAKVIDTQEAEWREGWLQPDLKPDDSASNLGWKTQGESKLPPLGPRRSPSDDVTTLGYFLNRGGRW